ncbi:MAG: AAA family ATPase [Termitinemataceae bacterium]|nr:MAG: AAA family ATPase [Termitinemataceae bacterium]
MIKEDLIKNSPVRILEKKTGGTLGAGEIGVLIAPKGVGKTSVIVQIALDKLLQDKKVIHISFNQQSDDILDWYKNIFDELTKKRNVTNEDELKDELIRNRIIMNFNQESVTVEVIRNSLRAMIVDGKFKAESVIIDGFEFAKAKIERISTLKTFAKELGFSIWYSYSSDNVVNVDKNGVPQVLKTFEDMIDVIVSLDAKPGCTELSVVKNRDKYRPADSTLKLDTKTLLILQ